MTFAVVFALRAHRDLAAAFLPAAIHDVVDGGGRTYTLFRSRRGDDVEFVDAVDNELLLGLKFFGSEHEARSWIAADIVLRSGPARVQ